MQEANETMTVVCPEAVTQPAIPSTIYCCIGGVAILLLAVLTPRLATAALDAIDELIARILNGPKMKKAVTNLVGGLLQQDTSQEAIARAVNGVLHNPSTRSEIANVVTTVLQEDHLRNEIATIVREVLHDEQLSGTISGVVGGCLNHDVVASGIASAIKGTSRNVLIDTVHGTLPPWMASRLSRRRILEGSNSNVD